MFLVSGILSAINAYLLNRWILNRTGSRGIVLMVPLIEELSKTLIALLLKSAIIETHITFGVIEAIYDIKTTSKGVGRLAALASIISHSIFGWLTYVIYTKTGLVSVGIIIAWVLHSGWNWYITKYA
ncbi:hypothetical protein F8154_12395 [Alkaliphilus pronyensis]|uniref:CPBP family intramembrane metalloprotease n=1 Tax=Alkaliphilus pronyensis TaxID=1482732 RepID=A0A6I0F5T2_9FIRM|nr:hypothetical protein [Alkaliphilus pronyensis]KAB3531904.1 hypothetical protein F8154_12395 [Alkaliphilus pronyensis]